MDTDFVRENRLDFSWENLRQWRDRNAWDISTISYRHTCVSLLDPDGYIRHSMLGEIFFYIFDDFLCG